MEKWIEFVCIAVFIAVCIFTGWHFGAQSVQIRWNAAIYTAAQAEQKKEAQDQFAADTASKMVETELDKRGRAILELNTELNDAVNKLGTCGKQSLPLDSMHVYSRAASTK